MPVPHVFDRVRVIEKTKQGSVFFTLEDTTNFGIPPSGYMTAQQIQKGDALLLDFSDWEGETGVAHMFVFRNGRFVTECGLGHGCDITSPALP